MRKEEQTATSCHRTNLTNFKIKIVMYCISHARGETMDVSSLKCAVVYDP